VACDVWRVTCDVVFIARCLSHETCVFQFYNTWGACYTLQALHCHQQPSLQPDFKSACEVLQRAKRAGSPDNTPRAAAQRGRGRKRGCAEYAVSAHNDAAAADAPCEAKALAPKEDAAADGQELDSQDIERKCLAVGPPPPPPPFPLSPRSCFSSICSLLFSAALLPLIVAVFEFRTQFERSPSPSPHAAAPPPHIHVAAGFDCSGAIVKSVTLDYVSNTLTRARRPPPPSPPWRLTPPPQRVTGARCAWPLTSSSSPL
jgi:hypothetical protein